MTILHVINAIRIGGAETFLLRLVKELERKGHKSLILTFRPHKNELDFLDFFSNQTNATIISHYQTPKSINWILQKLNGVTKRLFGKEFYNNYIQKRKDKYYTKLFNQTHNIDIINSQIFDSDFYSASYLKPLLKKPLVVSSHGCYNDSKNQEKIKTILNISDGFTYVAAKNLNNINELQIDLPENNRLIYNGYKLESGTISKKREDVGLKDNDFVLGQISRSMPSKGMEIAIEAVKKLQDEGYTQVKLILVGPENEYYYEVKEKYKNLTYVIFPGQSMNPIEWVNIFDLGVLPSYFHGESCPNSIVEYLSMAKPVLATDIGEIKSMIDSNGKKAGLLLQRNLVDGQPESFEMAEKIKEIMKSDVLYNELSEIAPQAFKKFDIETCTDSYLEVFDKAIKSDNKSNLH
jgi:glycosyltransferase involved in cell wall biosynthesis